MPLQRQHYVFGNHFNSKIFTKLRLLATYSALWYTFEPNLENLKKIYSKKNLIFSQKKVFLIFQEIELSSRKLKNFLIFSQKKLFLYFVKWNFLAPSLKNLYFRKQFWSHNKLNKISSTFFYFFLNKLIILFLFLKILRDIRNAFRLEKENKGIKDIILRNIWNLLRMKKVKIIINQ